jgi:hypothetical protein
MNPRKRYRISPVLGNTLCDEMENKKQEVDLSAIVECETVSETGAVGTTVFKSFLAHMWAHSNCVGPAEDCRREG